MRSFSGGRAALMQALADELADERSLAVLAGVTAIAVDPPLVALVDEQAAPILTDLTRAAWRTLVRQAKRLDETSAADELHDVRIAVKRVRYAADLTARVRPEARLHVRALARLQTTLGNVNDASLVIARLQAGRAGLDGDALRAADAVLAREARRVEHHRHRWPKRWDAARARRSAGWLRDRG